MAQSEFTDLLKLNWLPQHSLAAWTIQAFTGPLWQYLPSLAFSNNTGLCWPIHTFGPLRGLWLSLAHSPLDNVDLCWPTPTPLIIQVLAHSFPTSPPAFAGHMGPAGPLEKPGPSLAHTNQSHLDNVDLCWSTVTPLIHSDRTGHMGLAGPLEQPWPLLAHTDPTGPLRFWPSLAHSHLDNVDIFLAHSDSTDLLQQYWPLLAHLDPTSPLDNTAGHMGPGSPLEQSGPLLAHTDPVGSLALEC